MMAQEDVKSCYFFLLVLPRRRGVWWAASGRRPSDQLGFMCARGAARKQHTLTCLPRITYNDDTHVLSPLAPYKQRALEPERESPLQGVAVESMAASAAAAAGPCSSSAALAASARALPSTSLVPRRHACNSSSSSQAGRRRGEGAHFPCRRRLPIASATRSIGLDLYQQQQYHQHHHHMRRHHQQPGAASVVAAAAGGASGAAAFPPSSPDDNAAPRRPPSRPRPPPTLTNTTNLRAAPVTPWARFLVFAADLARSLWQFLCASAALLPQFSAPAPAEALRRLGMVLAASLVMVAVVSAVDGTWMSMYLRRAAARGAGFG